MVNPKMATNLMTTKFLQTKKWRHNDYFPNMWPDGDCVIYFFGGIYVHVYYDSLQIYVHVYR